MNRRLISFLNSFPQGGIRKAKCFSRKTLNYFIMKSLKKFESFRLKKNQLTAIAGGADEYYRWTQGTFMYFSDTDDTGNPSESGDPINCSPVAVVTG